MLKLCVAAIPVTSALRGGGKGSLSSLVSQMVEFQVQ